LVDLKETIRPRPEAGLANKQYHLNTRIGELARFEGKEDTALDMKA
jgi:hypothetical protein